MALPCCEPVQTTVHPGPCRAGAKVSVGPNDCLRFVETPAMLRRGRQLDPLEARHGRQVTEIETKEPEAKGHRQRPIQEDQRRSDRCQGKEAGLAVDTRTPSCPIKFPSRHLDGELRVSLSRGRLTRWTRSGFSDGELLCSSLVLADMQRIVARVPQFVSQRGRQCVVDQKPHATGFSGNSRMGWLLAISFSGFRLLAGTSGSNLSLALCARTSALAAHCSRASD